MRNTILATTISLLVPALASAQFHTVTKGHPVNHCVTASNHGHDAQKIERMKCSPDTAGMVVDGFHTSAKKTVKKVKSEGRTLDFPIRESHGSLPELTIANLYREIVSNGILYPEIVLAQAILETGWFRSSLCRNRNNLFGLTNPRTGKYFEFGHWTESVRAYYTKVQYKYYQKKKITKNNTDYLKWLKDLPYATDKNYISSLIKVLECLSSY